MRTHYVILHLTLLGWLAQRSESVCCTDVGGECFTKDSPYNKMPAPKCFLPLFKLYTRNITEGVAISATSIPSGFVTSKKAIFIVHGWQDKPTASWITTMKTELLNKEDANIIVVDWDSKTRNLLYKQAAADSRVCGKAIYDLFHALQAAGLSRANSHCIGHSLGAHVCGYAGAYEKFGRISGIDPAGPEFESLPSANRLSKDKADFVDVIHTDGGGVYVFDYGSLIPMGHIDFYPNGGKKQPGCWLNRRKRTSWLRNLRERNSEESEDREVVNIDRLREKAVERLFRGDLSCSHIRSIWLYIESIKSENCVATKKCDNHSKITRSCSSCDGVCPVMGYHSIDYVENEGLYYLSTDSRSYYCE